MNGYELGCYDADAHLERKVALGGYVRGICNTRDHIYAGLSSKRGAPLTQRQTASIQVLGTRNWDLVHQIDCPFKEIYDIRSISKHEVMTVIIRMMAAQRELLLNDLEEKSDRDALFMRVAALEASTSRKVTMPMRAIVRAWKALRQT